MNHPDEAAHARHRALFEEMSLGVVYQDDTGAILSANPAAERILGLTLSQLRGRTSMDPCWACLREDGRPLPGEEHPSMIALRTGEQVRNVVLRVARPGEAGHRWLNVSAVPRFRPGEARAFEVFTTFSDITDRKQRDEEVIDAARAWQATFDAVSDAICVLTPDRRIRYCNCAVEAQVGRARAELVGRPCWEVIHGASAPLPGCPVTGMCESRQRAGTELCVAGRWTSITVDPILDERGELAGIVHVQRDMTQGRAMEEALRESQRQLQTLLSNLPGMAYRCRNDEDWTMEFVSEGCRGLTGHAPEDLVASRRVSYAGLIHPEDRAAVRDAVQAALRERKAFQMVYRIRTAAGDEKWVWEQGVGVFDAATGALEALEGFIGDVTARQRTDLAQRELERRAQHAQKLESLGILAGGIAHDFNNLLTAVQGNLSLALDELPPASPARGHLRDAEHAARRAADLTGQMLAYSGKGQFQLQPVDLRELVEETVQLLQVSISKKARLRFDFAAGLPRIKADPIQLRQVVTNLVVNASEALRDRPGIIALSTGEEHCDAQSLAETWPREPHAEGHYLYLEVSDDGCGIAHDQMPRIFDPFFTTKFTGRGLGLPAVLGIVRGHRGAIRIRSEVNRGTSFRVLLPATPADGLPARKTHAETPGWRGAGRILLVDDEEAVRSIGAKVLQRTGFEVSVAANGLEALDALRDSGPFDAVLLDLIMPGMDGEETLRTLRLTHPDLPVIMSSGYPEQEVAQRIDPRQVSGFVQKPYTLATLRSAIEQALTGR